MTLEDGIVIVSSQVFGGRLDVSILLICLCHSGMLTFCSRRRALVCGGRSLCSTVLLPVPCVTDNGEGDGIDQSRPENLHPMLISAISFSFTLDVVYVLSFCQ
jgi:hypothetical protein